MRLKSKGKQNKLDGESQNQVSSPNPDRALVKSLSYKDHWGCTIEHGRKKAELT